MPSATAFFMYLEKRIKMFMNDMMTNTRELKKDDIVEEREIKSIDDLYNKIIYSDDFEGYVFRGHSRGESYKLVPGILRDFESLGNKSRGEFYFEELCKLVRFYRESNTHGLPVPHLPSFYKYGLSSMADLSWMIKDGEWSWIPDDFIELMSLAQHYGMKTRVLDWTQDIRVALYFACADENTVTEMENNEDMAVWCIAAAKLGNIRYEGDFARTKDIHVAALSGGDMGTTYNLTEHLLGGLLPLRFWVPTYLNNDNIRAQKGLLSMWQYNLAEKDLYKNSANRKSIQNIPRKNSIPEDDKEKRSLIGSNIKEFLKQPIKRDAAPLDELLLDYFDQEKSTRNIIFNLYKNKNKKIMYKIVLDRQMKQDMRIRLKKDGYTKATIFPGYRSVIEDIENGENF